MIKLKLISVILPVRNGEDFIKDAIFSILKQTYKNFELLIINDGSTDNTLNIINSIIDSRIKVHTTKGVGLVEALNLGIELSEGEFIARMDADDLCLSERFEKQVKILNYNNNIGVVFSGAEIIDLKNQFVKLIQLSPPFEVMDSLRFLKPYISLIHPTAMLRKSDLIKVGGYREYKSCEDRDLWIRLCQVTEFYFIPEPLLRYRINDFGVSHLNSVEQVCNGVLCVYNYEVLLKYGVDLYVEDFDQLMNSKDQIDAYFFNLRKSFYGKLLDFFLKLTSNKYIHKKMIFIMFYNNSQRRKIINILLNKYQK
jgi:glycosyltransferase involved in cell wall biosynthesis